MIKKSSAKSFELPQSNPGQAGSLVFFEKCCMCKEDVPDNRLVIRHEITRNIICQTCIGEIAEIE